MKPVDEVYTVKEVLFEMGEAPAYQLVDEKGNVRTWVKFLRSFGLKKDDQIIIRRKK